VVQLWDDPNGSLQALPLFSTYYWVSFEFYTAYNG
jgi:hypothetical protein